MKKFDSITWIGLALCALLFVYHIHQTKKQTEWRVEQEKIQQIEEAKKAAAEEENDIAEAELGESEGAEAEPLESDSASIQEAPEVFNTIETAETAFHFTTRGGGIKYAEFKDQLEVGSADKHVRLSQQGTIPVGALTKGGVKKGLDLAYEVYKESPESIEYKHETKDGLRILKRWSKVPKDTVGEDYLLKLTMIFRNANEDKTLSLDGYSLFSGAAAPLYQREWDQQTGFFVHNTEGKFIYHHAKWFEGGMFKKKKSAFGEQFEGVTYGGTSNQFFATILSPDEAYKGIFYASPFTVTLPEEAGGGEKKAVAGALSLPALTLAPGETRSLSYEVFMGPKRNKMMRELGRERGKVMHYGFFSWVSRVLNWMLVMIHDKIFDPISEKWAWGLAVVLLTLIIRTLIWPLHNVSTRSMKRMSKLQPLMKGLREKHADDPQKLNTEMLKLYREYKINPAGGCLPMLLQMPIFFGFYKMLQHAVEMRDQSFLWVDDLSQPDTIYTLGLPFPMPFLGSEIPINLLPILMAVTMVGQMMVTPKTGDKMQQRIMLLMPLVFFFFCYNFAAALALYWTTQNIFSMGQTLYMQRLPEPELKKATSSKGWMEKLQERAEEAKKVRKQMAQNQGRPGMPDKKAKKPRGPRTGG